MSISDRLDKREEYYKVAIARLRRAIEKGVLGEDSEEIRSWIERYAVGKGLDICAGDFPIGEQSDGIDPDIRKLGNHYNISGDELTPYANGELDYVVTNYFDCFPNPLHTLQEWNRVIRVGGTLAFACCNATEYESSGPLGPLVNGNRLSAFTKPTILCLLARAGFVSVEVTKHNKHLFVKATKA